MTICAQGRECLFGDVVDGEMRLNDAGIMVCDAWHKIPKHFLHTDIDEFVVMPNHIHGIIMIVGAQFIAPIRKTVAENQGVINHAPTVGEIVRAFKARCTHAINRIHNTLGYAVWQRNYYEHVIRDGKEMDRIRGYIIDNPAKWNDDEDNPANITCKGLINQTPTFM